jgi:hypothetical protein
VDVRQLIKTLAAREEALRRGGQFLAPCVSGGQVRVSLDGLVQTFRPRPRDFEGWGVFEAIDERTARVAAEATLPQVAGYLKLLKPWRVHLVQRLRGRTWLAYPSNVDDARRQFGVGGELLVHLVPEGARFEVAIAYTDGCNWLLGELDRRADARIAERLREFLRQGIAPHSIDRNGTTPEMRAAYALATGFVPEFRVERARRADEKRLRAALALNGGELVNYEDEDENWRITWRTPGGDDLVSTIGKRDLTVISAGICLSGQDADFDLQSLVGVVESEWNY